MLSIKDLVVRVDNKSILKGISLDVAPGTVHAIMGPNGSGKSTLGYTLAGRAGYEIEKGSVTFNGLDLTKMDPSERALQGLFLAFQYPVSVPGVSNINFLKAMVNAKRKHDGLEELDTFEFLAEVKALMKQLGMKEELISRSVNDGFSGGEKKRNEILQMALLKPKLAILDETDSGLDIDALRIVADGVNSLRSPDRSMIVVTHYQRLLDLIEPDYVHVLAHGQIVQSGDKNLALSLESTGYGFTKGDAHEGA